MPLTKAQQEKARQKRLADTMSPSIRSGTGKNAPDANAKTSAIQQQDAINNRSTNSRTVRKGVTPPASTYNNANPYNTTPRVSTYNNADPFRTKNPAVDSSLAGAPRIPNRIPNRGVRPTANAQELDNAVTDSQSDGGLGYRNTLNQKAMLSEQANQAKVGAYRSMPGHVGAEMTDPLVVEQRTRENMIAGAPQFEVPGRPPQTTMGGAYKPQNVDEFNAINGVRSGTHIPNRHDAFNMATDMVQNGALDPLGRPVSTISKGLGIMGDFVGEKGRQTQNAEEFSPIIRGIGKAVGTAGEAIGGFFGDDGPVQGTLDGMDERVDQAALDYINDKPNTVIQEGAEALGLKKPIEINLNDYSTGYYIVKVFSDNQTFASKVLIN
jgi:hypothetical protein